MDDDPEPNEPNPQNFLLVSVLLELGLGLLALVFGWIWGPDPRALVPRYDQAAAIGWGLGLGILAAVPILVVVQLIEYLPLEPIRQLQKATEEKLVALMSGLNWAELGAVSLCAGVGEELLFRGWLMMSLAGPIEGWDTPVLIAAVVLSSIAFGLAHPITPAYTVITGLIGVYLGMLLVWTENLLVPIAAHAFYDFVQLILATRIIRTKAQDES